MGIEPTKRWIERFSTKQQSITNVHDLHKLQERFLVEPLYEHFRYGSLRNVHEILMRNGLSPPHAKLSKWIKLMKKKEVYVLLERQFHRLKEDWKGPNIPVYLFPLDERNHFIMKNLGKKNGVTFPSCILLFVHEYTEVEDICALLTHEYSHACRIEKFSIDEKTVSLLESMVMEGIAEMSVLKYHGEKHVAQWTKGYSETLLQEWWHRAFMKRLNMRGLAQQHPFLYGGKYQLPPWIGYALGFSIVEKYQRQTKEDVDKILNTSAEYILQRSRFEEEKKENH
ncbi:DUF2268 domain-containing putative Zn-dependent protease [Texcoconibacillus texcoconensis]|uniref:Uncharacterized protein YjaZ n=1 Tax=Texcoconibacillus texcoconensis TaxID=1095777 RepID=A0A840QU67_9BACI|nr:uncharacterized protein YjaZ [Texcoconibacillus texcoconensis]